MTLAAPAPLVLAQEVTSEIRNRLDATDKLEPGRGQLDLGAYVRGIGDTGIAGGQLEYQHRTSQRTSIFGRGSVGYGWGQSSGIGYEATAGLRMRF